MLGARFRTPPAPAAANGARRVGSSREGALDGLRGLAIVLVVLSHGWIIWAQSDLADKPALLHLFQSGNLAVSVFFVVAGFLLVRSLLNDRGPRLSPDGTVVIGPAAHPWRAVANRWVRLSAQVYPLALDLLLVAWLDPTDIQPLDQTRDSLFHIVTYTWNTYLQRAALISRPDLGHLWYTSVYLQATIVLVIIVRVLGRRTWALTLALVATLALVTAWRGHVLAVEDISFALLRTTTRVDGMFWGALLAVAWPWVQRFREAGSSLLSTGLIGLTALVLTTGYSPDYLGWIGVATNLATVSIIAGSLMVPRMGLSRALGWRPLATLGRYSLALYIWHFPVFWAVTRHSLNWPIWLRIAVPVVITAILVVTTTRWIENPVARLLASLLDRWPWRRRVSLSRSDVDAPPNPTPAEPAHR